MEAIYAILDSAAAVYWVIALWVTFFILPIVVGRYVRASYAGRQIGRLLRRVWVSFAYKLSKI